MWLLDMEVFCAGGVDDNGTKHNLLSLITNFEYQLANPHFWLFTLNFAIQQMTKIAWCKFIAITCDLKNMISINTKDFAWKKMTQICQISKEKKIPKSKF
jgi:hypothetical protein